MKNILLLSTGGTIASTPTSHGLTPEMSGDMLVGMIPKLEGLCNIDCREIMNIDSTNMQPKDWILMATSVYDNLNNYDGFVITHGTDTMPYSTAALSLMLINLNKPVIFTGSQIAMSLEDSDGPQNLYDAFLTASSGIPGVYITFAGKIIKGSCAKKLYTKNLTAFESINEDIVGIVEDGIVKFAPWVLEEIEEGKSLPGKKVVLDTKLDENVVLIKLIPGMDERVFEAVLDMGYKGIVIEAFGSGGIPNITDSMISVICKACKRGVVVMIATQCVYDGTDIGVYDVGVSAAKAGVLSAEMKTTEATVVELMWKIGHMS